MNTTKAELKPCKCGSENTIVWLEHESAFDPAQCMTDINKIECADCGRVVWGGDAESVKDWNEQKYD